MQSVQPGEGSEEPVSTGGYFPRGRKHLPLILSVLVCFPLPWSTPQLKAAWGGKDGFGLHVPRQSALKGNQGRKSSESRGMHHGGTLLWCALGYLSDHFLLQLRTTCPGLALSTVDLALPHQSLIKRMPRRLAYQTIWRDNSSTVVPSSQVALFRRQKLTATIFERIYLEKGTVIISRGRCVCKEKLC